MPSNLERVDAFLRNLQDRICAALEQADGEARFVEDAWTRSAAPALAAAQDTGGPAATVGWPPGGGRTRVLRDGAVIEQGGVNYSRVAGASLPASATQHRPQLAGRQWAATGVSLVIHPRNPYVPTSHANVRYFEADKEGEAPVWWFGGGFDLTPFYPFDEDCVHWHEVARDLCAPFGTEVYPKYKHWCDEYFYLQHRKEPRGIGGIFYDHHDSGDWDADFAFTREVGRAFARIYPELVRRNFAKPWSPAERDEQLIRRGRYVEFNLLYDRGTTFGLKTGGNVDSILSSMPPEVKWP